jgi:hypothetical protein
MKSVGAVLAGLGWQRRCSAQMGNAWARGAPIIIIRHLGVWGRRKMTLHFSFFLSFFLSWRVREREKRRETIMFSTTQKNGEEQLREQRAERARNLQEEEEEKEEEPSRVAAPLATG